MLCQLNESERWMEGESDGASSWRANLTPRSAHHVEAPGNVVFRQISTS